MLLLGSVLCQLSLLELEARKRVMEVAPPSDSIQKEVFVAGTRNTNRASYC